MKQGQAAPADAAASTEVDDVTTEAEAVSEAAPEPAPEPTPQLSVRERRRQAELAELEEIEKLAQAKKEDEISRLAAENKRRQAASAPVQRQRNFGPDDAPAAGEGGGINRRRKAAEVETPRRTPGRGRENDGRRQGKMTISQALSGGEGSRQRSIASVRRQREKARMREDAAPAVKQVRDVVIPDTITVGELANRMAERTADVVKSS